MRNGELFEQAMLVRHIGESDCSLWPIDVWPTPSSMDGSGCRLRDTPEIWREQSEKHAAKGQHKQFPLGVAANLNASEPMAKKMLWPTPVTMDVRAPNKPETVAAKAAGETAYGLELRDAVMLWPTPTATEHLGAANTSLPKEGQVAPASKHGLKTVAVGVRNGIRLWEAPNELLNPSWVELLMGFPYGWTDGLPRPEKTSMNGSNREQSQSATTDPTD
jgi:hypothetical protein